MSRGVAGRSDIEVGAVDGRDVMTAGIVRTNDVGDSE